mmetsp:Transcript_7884/g.18433  ORF Transcript_7884/g.18433 Transcript_7884/m.18433 type:complete len:208 (-) Transcript_7884:967-1590(-)
MFITVSAATRTKTKRRTGSTQCTCDKSWEMSLRKSSDKTPNKSKWYIEVGTELNISSPTGSPAVSCVKAMPNMYSTMNSNKSVKNTERIAANNALIKINNSGIARKTLATRAILDNRRRRITLSTDAFTVSPPLLLPPEARSSIGGNIHVSMTMVMTKMLSNKYHLSSNMSFFWLKATNRMSHSSTKRAQKRFSATMNVQCALYKTL